MDEGVIIFEEASPFTGSGVPCWQCGTELDEDMFCWACGNWPAPTQSQPDAIANTGTQSHAIEGEEG